MQSKTMSFLPNEQHLVHNIPAGIRQEDKRTEIFACRDTKKVFGISEGKTVPFDGICESKRKQLRVRLDSDFVAQNDLKELTSDQALEQYAFCVFGGLDHNADFSETGELKESDNFLCSTSCRCIYWLSKNITVNGRMLTPKKLQIITLLASDLPDKQIAADLSITQSTLDTHKTQLFEIFNVHSKHGLIVEAIKAKIVQ